MANTYVVRAGTYQGFAPGVLFERVVALIAALESTGLGNINDEGPSSSDLDFCKSYTGGYNLRTSTVVIGQRQNSVESKKLGR